MSKRNQSTARRKSPELDSRLSDYSAIAHMSAAASKLNGRVGNWPIYAAVAGSALAMATGASASIITGTYNPSSNTVVPNTAGNSGNFRTVHGSDPLGADHFVIKAISGLTASGPTAALSVIGVSAVGVFQSALHTDVAKKFVFGAPISAAAGVYAAGVKIVKAHFYGQDYGQFTVGGTGYAGLAINVSGQIDYGWLKLSFADGKNGLPDSLSAVAFGIELNGSQIDAGQTVEPTPEPGTMALALLATGAAGVAALRRRRLAKV